MVFKDVLDSIACMYVLNSLANEVFNGDLAESCN